MPELCSRPLCEVQLYKARLTIRHLSTYIVTKEGISKQQECIIRFQQCQIENRTVNLEN